MLNIELIELLMPYEDCIDGFDPMQFISDQKYASANDLLLIAKKLRDVNELLSPFDQMLKDCIGTAEKLEKAASEENKLSKYSKGIRRTTSD